MVTGHQWHCSTSSCFLSVPYNKLLIGERIAQADSTQRLVHVLWLTAHFYHSISVWQEEQEFILMQSWPVSQSCRVTYSLDDSDQWPVVLNCLFALTFISVISVTTQAHTMLPIVVCSNAKSGQSTVFIFLIVMVTIRPWIDYTSAAKTLKYLT